jgi:hypothetical protein
MKNSLAETNIIMDHKQSNVSCNSNIPLSKSHRQDHAKIYHVNIYVNLKNIKKLSEGIISSLNLSNDRMAISFRDSHGAFDLIKGSLDYWFPFISCKKGNKGHTVYRYKYGLSNIFLVEYPYNPDPYQNWDRLTITNPDTYVQTKIKQILENHIENKSRMSLSQVEFALDIHYYTSDYNLINQYNKIINHYLVLCYSRENSYNNYKGTDYQGKNGNVREGSKGLRSYIKIENNCTFSRIELQANRLLLKKNGLNVSSLPIRPDSINIFKYIELRQGLTESSLNRLASTLAKKFYKSTRDNPLLTKKNQNDFQGIYKALILHELNCINPSDLTEVPVAKQINVFKRFKKDVGITNQVEEYFPKMSWEELFNVIKQALPLDKLSNNKLHGINLDEIQPKKVA